MNIFRCCVTWALNIYLEFPVGWAAPDRKQWQQTTRVTRGFTCHSNNEGGYWDGTSSEWLRGEIDKKAQLNKCMSVLVMLILGDDSVGDSIQYILLWLVGRGSDTLLCSVTRCVTWHLVWRDAVTRYISCHVWLWHQWSCSSVVTQINNQGDQHLILIETTFNIIIPLITWSDISPHLNLISTSTGF